MKMKSNIPNYRDGHYKNTKGFTLVETLVTIFVFTLIISGSAVLFKEVFSNSNQKNIALSNIDQARLAEFNFVNEIRSATMGNDGSYPVSMASSSEIVIYTGYGSSGLAVNRIRYYVVGSTLYKGLVVPTGNPLSYNLSSEKVSQIQSGVTNGTSPVFYYYDADYAGTSTPLAYPVNLNKVRFVKMNLILLKQDISNATSTFTVSAGATVRSLKDNLGN